MIIRFSRLLYFIIPVILITLIPKFLQGQYFSTGQDPASLRWRQIKTGKFRIIYPSLYETRAQYIANIMDQIWKPETKTLSAKPPRIPVILHTESSISNGVTVWAPKRIEFYPTTDPDAYAEEWLEQLAIHEYRHSLQINKMNKGFTRALYYIFGEQATGGILGAFVPTWFLEGDATCTETSLTSTGRGRVSKFGNILRAQLLEKGQYSFNKATLGSYKTFVPGAYELGYFLVGMGRKDYGPKIWDYSLDHVAKYPFMIIPFADGIKRTTGLSKVKWYKKTLSELDSIWKEQQRKTLLTPGSMISRRKSKDYTTFTHPIFLNDTAIIAERSSNEDVDRIVKIDRNGKEKKLLRVGAYLDGSNSVSKNLIAWAEYEPDLRWDNRNYSDIRLFDLNTGKTRSLTRKSRYFSPNLSHNAKMIVAVRVSAGGESFLEILSTSDGKVLYSLKTDGSATFQSPDFTDDDRELIYIFMNEKGKTIASLDIASGRVRYHLPFTFTGIDGPSLLFKSYILFSADFSGIENMYAVDTSSGKVFQVTSAPFGASDPDLNQDKSELLYSEYCSDGLMISKSVIDTSAWVPLERVKNNSFRLYDILSDQEGVNLQDTLRNKGLFKMLQDSFPVNDSSLAKIRNFESKKYSKTGHLFNIHSWAPVSASASNLTLHPGVMALSQNLLSSCFASAGYDWDYNDQTGKFYLDFSYQALFPVFDFNVSYGSRAGYYVTDQSMPVTRFTWNEAAMALQISIPFNLGYGLWSRNLTPGISCSLTDVIHTKSTPDELISGWINIVSYTLNYSQYIRSNYQDMYPRWGQVIGLTYRHSPFRGNELGSIWAAQMNLYFPGFLRHHGLWLYGGYQQKNENYIYGYSYSDIIQYPRGYAQIDVNHFFSFSANYKFPLFCPDWSVGSVFYFKRFKLNLFYDQAMGDNSSAIDWKLPDLYQTIGSELTGELHILRFVYPFELGIRPMYFPTGNNWGFQFLYSVSF